MSKRDLRSHNPENPSSSNSNDVIAKGTNKRQRIQSDSVDEDSNSGNIKKYSDNPAAVSMRKARLERKNNPQ